MTPEIDCGTVDTNTTPEPSKLELAQQAMRLRQEELHERAKAKAQGKRVNVVRDLSSMVGKVMAQLETPTRETLRQELTPALIAATQHLELTILSDESTASQKSKAVDQVFTLLKALSKAEARHMELLARVADSKAARANASAAIIRARTEDRKVAIQQYRNNRNALHLVEKERKRQEKEGRTI